jgi:hypothetical protein
MEAYSQLAFGRTAAALKLAQSPQFRTVVAKLLQAGANKLTDARLARLGRRFGRLISPTGTSAALTSADALALLKAFVPLVRPKAKRGPVAVAPAIAKKAVDTAFSLISSRSTITLPARKTRALPLRFALPPGKPLASLNGTLVVDLAGVATPLTVTAKVQELSPIAVEPPTVVIEHSTASVDLVGPGVRELLAHPDASPPSVRLRSGDHEVTATLKVPATHTAGAPDRATATVALSGDPYPGKYAGDLPIRSVLPGKPTVGVEVRAHRSIWLAFLFIFGGAFIGGLLGRLAALARRRELLRESLEESLAKYGPLETTRQGWSMEALLGPQPWEADEDAIQGASGLLGSIQRGRSSADLDDDTARVLDMVARLQRWLRLEPAIRRLRLVQVEIPEGAGWTATYAWRATEELLAAARREPPNAEAADALVARILRHAIWHHRFAVAWAAASSYQERDRLKALDEANGATEALKVTPEQQDTLDIQLRTLLAAFGATAAAITNMPVPPGEPVVWEASPNQFTGWATLDGKSYGQLVHEARAGSRAYNPLTLLKELRRVGRLDGVATLAAVALACLVYLPTVYNDTWGNLTDILTAVTAGVLGHVAIKWAALPAFQSLRLRSPASAA